MRSIYDRIRHALSFELIALIIIIPTAAFFFDKPIESMGVVGVLSATLATAWNYIYNLAFDTVMMRVKGTTLKTTLDRVVHSLLFELGLLVALLPLIAWYLQIGFWEAFIMDISFALFYVVYAFCFNWLYDRVYPLPEWNK